MLTFDFETTNHSKGSALDSRNRILMVVWQEDDGPRYSHVGDITLATEFFKALDRNLVLCAYNAKFEQHWFLRLGLDIDRWAWHDPMLAEKVLLGNVQKPVNMGDVAERYGYDTKDRMIDSMMKSGVCPSEMPQKRLLARCMRDVRVTRQLLANQLDRLKQRDQLAVYRLRCDFTKVLTVIEHEGMLLDEALVRRELDTHQGRLAEVERELTEITGGINLRSTDQLAEFLYETLKFPERKVGKRTLRGKPSKRWPEGKPKTDKLTMSWLAGRAKTEQQKEFIRLRQEYGKLNAALTKNLEFFDGVCEERDGKFNAVFNQTVAATHRLTSSGLPLQFEKYPKPKSVQFQNMPRIFKKLFIAPEGYYVVEVDAMQLEFRVAAYLGQDKQAMADIADPDFDAHCRSGSVMNEIAYETFLEMYRSGVKEYKAMRQDAKPDTFKPLYGGTKGTPAQERWYKEFQTRYSGVYATQENWLADVNNSDGELVLPWGMRFHWDTYQKNGVLFDKRTHKPVGPQVFNYPVQNLATAEIVPMAIIALYRRCKAAKLDVKFVNTVHDSIICYVRIEHIDAFLPEARQAFTTDVYERLELDYGLKFNVPLGAEIVYGTHWGEGKEIKHDDVGGRT